MLRAIAVARPREDASHGVQSLLNAASDLPDERRRLDRPLGIRVLGVAAATALVVATTASSSPPTPLATATPTSRGACHLTRPSARRGGADAAARGAAAGGAAAGGAAGAWPMYMGEMLSEMLTGGEGGDSPSTLDCT